MTEALFDINVDISSNKRSMLIFLYLEKAFDSVIGDKLENIGVLQHSLKFSVQYVCCSDNLRTIRVHPLLFHLFSRSV